MLGGWLTHGDFALEADVDFLAVIEHRLVPARVRSEWVRLRARGASSVWSSCFSGVFPCWSWWCWGRQLEGCSAFVAYLC